MNISQIYISDNPMPEHIKDCVETVKGNYPEANHTLFDDELLRNFIKTHFDATTLNAYDKLRPYSYKADLGKYCLLYEYGGWYFDIAVKINMPIKVAEMVETVAYRDMQLNSNTNYSVSCGAIYSVPRHPVFKKAIEITVDNCLHEYYGITPLCPTGPTVLGKAFALQKANSNMVFGDYMYLTPTRQIGNQAFVLPDGKIHAFGKSSNGGNLNADGTNNYNTFYHSKTVYK